MAIIPEQVFIEKNDFGNVTAFHKFGENTAVGTSFVPIVVGGAINFLTSPTTVEAISGNAADTLLGLGVRKILVQGLDETNNIVEEEINMNGTSASTATTTTFIRVWRAYATEVGTYGGANYADITVRVSGGGATLIVINGKGTLGTSGYGSGQSQTTLFSVPQGQTLYIKGIDFIIDSSKNLDLTMYRREDFDNTTTDIKPRRVVWSANGISGSYNLKLDSKISVPEKSDIWFEGKFAAGTGGVSISYDFILVENPSV